MIVEPREAIVVGRLFLDMTLDGEARKKTARSARSLSGVDRQGDCLFLGSDEGPGLERLEAAGKNEYGGRVEFPLKPLFDLPGPDDVEADIESISIHRGWLWLVTSHALTRSVLGADLDAFADIQFHPQRYVLGRIPLKRDGNGRPTPVRRDGSRHAGCLPLSPSGSLLTDAIAGDPHLRRSLAIPAKENGLDIEAIAVFERRVILGLRGPVLRGRAVLLNVEWPQDGGEEGAFQETRAALPYRKVFLELGGLGVRDLCRRRRDLVILAGPTMPQPAPYRLYVIRKFFSEPNPESIATPDYLFDVPSRHGNPEGLTLYDKGTDTFLVVLDGTEPKRKRRARALLLRAP